VSDFPSKQHPIAAARKDKIGTFEDLPESATGKLRVEVSHAVEPDQARNEPVASHLASATHTRGIEVRCMPRVAVTVVRIATESCHQLLPNSRILTNIIEVLHQFAVDVLHGPNALWR